MTYMAFGCVQGRPSLAGLALSVGLVISGAAGAQAETVTAPIGVAAQDGAAPAHATPQQTALTNALDARKLGPTVAEFYAARSYAPVWTGADGAPRRAALFEALAAAGEHALPVEPYGTSRLKAAAGQARTSTQSIADQVALELDLTAAYLRYARDVSSGLLEPRKIDRELYVYPERRARGDLLAGLAAAAEPSAWMRGLAPQSAGYRQLLEKYKAYRALAATGGWGEQLTKRKTLRVGDRSSDVAVLRDRLTRMGYLSAEATVAADRIEIATAETANDAGEAPLADGWVFDPALEDAVRLFQARHGLNQDGAVGPATREAVNTDPGFRAAQVAVNLERHRWLNKDLGAKHILVNLASFDMAVMENGQSTFESRVVVGKARKHRTPEFSDEMEVMVVNPTWHVPRSIAREEILPELQKDPTYLERKGMRITGVEDPSLIDWELITPDSFPGRVKQRPGNGNALGRVKFLFPNDHAIYLHDTPSKSLFKRDRRAYSHGCVRVQRPFEFAEFLLAAQRDDPEAYFRTLLNRGSERYVNLDEHIPIHLTYRTAWVDSDGNDQFRGDIYGRDRKVLVALEEAGVALPAH
ncbi:MAG: L,D-transpeptidase family protein [Pseudomonadota bacterium]